MMSLNVNKPSKLEETEAQKSKEIRGYTENVQKLNFLECLKITE